MSEDGRTIVAADPDRDRVVLVDLGERKVVADLALEALSEPGRVVEGPAGMANVALRRGGAVVTIDLAKRAIVRSVEVCPAPRGMAFVDGVIHVACAGGELVTMNASSGAITRNLVLDADLRDVVARGSELVVSRFRSAEVLVIDESGALVDRSSVVQGSFARPSVAWRMVPDGQGGLAMVHQLASEDLVFPVPGGYGASPCGEGIVGTTVSFGMGQSGAPFFEGASIHASALPVDIAFSEGGGRFTVIAAGSNAVYSENVSTYRSLFPGPEGCGEARATPIDRGEPIAVAYAKNIPLIQTREPSRLLIGDDGVVELGGESMLDVGHHLFHHAPNEGLGMACASCHPEGRDDGHVWNFADMGLRRTQSLAGGVLATAPLHWDGMLDGFDALMVDVFSGRMGGEKLSASHMIAAAQWVDSIPLLPVSRRGDEEAIARGKAIFEDAAVGCATCHSGSRLTNNETMEVGTGMAFQVPSLRGIASRAPFMHDGCAATLEERFTKANCGGGDAHGVTSKLAPGEIQDLVRYLETL